MSDENKYLLWAIFIVVCFIAGSLLTGHH